MNESNKNRIAAINSGSIPEGYKKTKVGIVPVEWVDTHFSELFIEKKNVTSDFEKYPLYSLTIEEGVVPKSERYERSHLIKKDDIFKIVSKNDFVYNPMNVRFGALARYKGQEDVSVSGYYDIFSVNESVSKEYMENFLLSKPMINYYNRVSTGSLKEKQRVHFSQFLDFVLPIPPLPEQQKIADILSTQDKLIELQEKKIEQLKELKKAYLQKMFPKKGSKYPELRFKGFTDPWEQRKLSELLTPSDERNSDGKYTQDDVLAASLGTELVKKHIFFGLRSTEESVKNYRVVKSGDIIYTKSPIKGFPNGIVRTSKGAEGIVPSLYCVYKCTSSINPCIIQSYLEDKTRLDAYLMPLVNIGARNNVNITDLGFLEGTVMIPQDIEEQTKIVNLLDTLTELITLHQRKSEQEKQKKKALMQLLLTGKVRCI